MLTPAFPIAAMRALGSISRNDPKVVPVFDCPSAGEAPSSARRPMSAAPLMPARASLDDCELAHIIRHSRTVHLEDVEPRRDVEIVLGAEIPGHEAHVRAVLPQGLDEIPTHGVDA